MKASQPRRPRLPPEDVAARGATNRVVLSGALQERGGLRYTPAGIPVVEFRVVHASEQVEAGQPRRISCEFPCVAVGPPAVLLKDAPLGMHLTVDGFVAARSLKQPMPVLHVTNVEFAET